MNEEVLAEILQSLLTNPEYRKDLFRLVKKAKPELRIPEVDAEESITPLHKEIAELKEKLEQKEREEEYRRQRETIKQRGYDPDEVEKVMLDKGIVNPDNAIEYMELQKKLASPSRVAYGEVQEVPLTEIPKDVSKWAREEAMKVLSNRG